MGSLRLTAFVILCGLSRLAAAADPASVAAALTPALRARYPDLAHLLIAAPVIPGLNRGYVPQGIAFDRDRKLVMISADHDSQPSAVFAVDAATGQLRATIQLAFDRQPISGHVGGLTLCRGFLWTVFDGQLLRFPWPVEPLPETGLVLAADRREFIDSQASSISSTDDTLWIGEFALGSTYPTAAHHHVQGCKAWATAYGVDPAGELAATQSYQVAGRTVKKPARVILLPEKVQGFAMCGNLIAISQSYSAADSRLSLFRIPSNESAFDIPLPEGRVVRGQVLDETALAKRINLPAGSEDLEWTGSSLLVPFESGAQKHRTRWRWLGAAIVERWYELRLPESIPSQ